MAMFFIKYLRYLEMLLRNLLLNEKKVDIESMLAKKMVEFSAKTMGHIGRLFEKVGYEEVFGRTH